MHRPTPPPLPDVLDGARTSAILEDVVDHTNAGACFRSAAGLGIDAVLVTPCCADPLYRRSIRVSMGTVFQVPWTRIDPWPGALATLREAGFHTAALALSEDSIALEDFAANRPERLALILGTEGDGLAPATTTAADTVVRIPMYGGVDSLNVAAASAVAFWAIGRGAPNPAEYPLTAAGPRRLDGVRLDDAHERRCRHAQQRRRGIAMLLRPCGDGARVGMAARPALPHDEAVKLPVLPPVSPHAGQGHHHGEGR